MCKNQQSSGIQSTYVSTVNKAIFTNAQQQTITTNDLYAQQQTTNNLLLKCIEQQQETNNLLLKLIEQQNSLSNKIDKHLEQQNGIMNKIFQQLNIDNDPQLKFHGLHQHYVNLPKKEKRRTLIKYLGKLECNQVVIFVKSVSHCTALCKFLTEQGFPALETHHEIPQEQRLVRYKQFKEFQTRILVATNLFEYGLDIERVNIIFNYDMPEDTNIYLQRVARAGRIGTKGLAITFVVNQSDATILNEIQSRFQVQITEMPDHLDAVKYIENRR